MKLQLSALAVLLSASVAHASPAQPKSSPYSVQKGATDFNAACASIASDLKVENGVVYFSEFVAGGTNLTFPDNDPTCTQNVQFVPADICRIALYVSTSNHSGFHMETWLPSNWTGRYVSTGNGGLNGCIKYVDLAYTSGAGFAVAGTNNGHNGTGGQPFYMNADIVEDFAHRALYTGTKIGKKITKQFYGKSQKKSYYFGCSTGGRQGFKAAQTFSEEFDGIVAGAPAISFNNLTSWSGNFFRNTGTNTSDTFVTRAQWAMIHTDILKQCDMLDGYADGVIEFAQACNYDPSGLQCTGSANATCLTAKQVKTVNAVFSPVLDDKGNLVYPRMQPGSEVVASGVFYGGNPFPYTTDWYRYAVYNDSNWNPATISGADYANAARINPGDIQTWNGDLSAARKHTKILHWHGQMDAIISSANSPRYYEHVSKTMGLSPKQLDQFYRFFSVSGTAHCTGGDGAHMIGQAINEYTSFDPKENILMAIVDWVENGKAPETIIGTRYVNNTQSLGVQYKRAHCKYPKRNQYKGQGDPNVVSSWECVNQ